MSGDLSVGVCTACDLDCEATFVCVVCRERKNVCSCKVGGFDAKEDICSTCHFRRATLGASYAIKMGRRESCSQRKVEA